MDLRNNQDDRPYRMTTRNDYGSNQQWNEDETMSTQGYYREILRNVTEQRWFPLAAVTCGVIVFGSLIAFAYRQGAQTTANATTPLIQAENTPYKEKPQDAGGMDVPFQDAVVFDQLDNTNTADAGDKIENLLPPPEQPVEDPAKVADATTTTTPTTTAPAGETKSATETAPPSAPKEEQADKSVIAKTDTTDSVADKIAATEEAMKAKAAETKTATKETIKTETVKTQALKTETAAKTIPAKAEAVKTAVVATPAPVAKVETAAVKTETIAPAKTTTTAATPITPAKMNAVAPAAPTPAPVATGGSSKVQLGAFKDEAAARAAWAQFQKQYAPHLNGITPNYARADLGAKGVFYRVQGVNLSKTQAQSICQSINAQKAGSCLIPQ